MGIVGSVPANAYPVGPSRSRNNGIRKLRMQWMRTTPLSRPCGGNDDNDARLCTLSVPDTLICGSCCLYSSFV